MYRPYFDHGGPGWVGGLFGLLIVIAIVAGVVLLVRYVLERPHHLGALPAPPLSRAVEELDLRYARGEIDRAEYLQRRTDLMHGGHLAPPPVPPPPAATPPPPPPAP